ncbi:SIR2 family protein [Sphingomonas sp. Sphisp140]|uniref:SIR2 family NAD-dependent protein deacylase n=1 Tax=unclassified Sphingomonas TaxID=196159 RepID=UPI0039AF00E8
MNYFRQRFIDALNEEGDIEVAGQVWTRHQVLETMDAAAERDVFNGWVDEQKIAAKDRCHDFLRDYGCLQRFQAMMARHRNGFVLPFVGAGMSLASGFRLWGDFLTQLMADFPEALPDVQAHLALYEYEEAAERVLQTLGAGVLAEEISNQMGDHLPAALAGPVQLFPALFRTEVFTTNFDYVLDRAYGNADAGFAREFKGSELRQAAQRMANDPHCLLRLHGEGATAEDRVLTLSEYNAAYAENAGLRGALTSLIGTKSLLFMGCSLNTDRTFQALREIRDAANGEAVRHYAFLPFPGEARRATRRIALGEAEIHPIYYPPEDHDAGIEDLLITMMEGGL